MFKKVLLLMMVIFISVGTSAQRKMDNLGRGLVAVKTLSGVYCSWRIPGEEYYDVKYNIYRDGQKLNAHPLNVSNYSDAAGTYTSKYKVTAVVRGVEQAPCAEVSVWRNDYLEFPVKNIISRAGADITDDYNIHEASAGDVDGDGQVEIIVKRQNTKDAASQYANDYPDYKRTECYKLDGTLLWYIDDGPNLVCDADYAVYDWDEDGKCEVVFKAADGTLIHEADGTVDTIGDIKANYRYSLAHYSNMNYTHEGPEYLTYLNGATAKPYQIGPAAHPNYMDYPLVRGNVTDWGDGYGHRCEKFFYGAPFIDGRHASIFLGRGIYTKHKMAVLDVNRTTHQLTQRWYWTSDGLGKEWFGQGFHNYGIADVDWDGRDEIVYGNMVIDDNGMGLSTTGLGHADAQHCSDLDPYRHGQEIWDCGEASPKNNFRNATTGKIYYRAIGTVGDDGRCIAGKFTDKYSGCQMVSGQDGVISSVRDAKIPDASFAGMDLNFRIYWDGDLCEETLNGSSAEAACRIVKYGSWTPIYTASGTKLVNWTKNVPTLQADIFGDWREELVLRSEDNKNIRIYTTTVPTQWRNYSLWDDMQYRQGIVWQIDAYNQPPHTSYYLGQSDSITIAPPPLTMTGRTEVNNGGTIGTAYNDKHVLMAEPNDMTVSVTDGAAPYIYTDNAPTWVQGANSNSKITTTTYTHTLTGGAFAGAMRLVKQGDGVLSLPNVVEKYSGSTDLWAGTLNFDGTMQNSRVWMNRFAELNSNGGKFNKGIEMNYAAILRPGGAGKQGVITTDSLIMNYGSRIIFDVNASDKSADKVIANVLKLQKKHINFGPRYATPVFQLKPTLATGQTSMPEGDYLLAEVGKIDGDIDSVIVEGLNGQKSNLKYESGKLYVHVEGMRAPSTVEWTGSEDGTWDLSTTNNFQTQDGAANVFVTGDAVTFNDKASNTNVNIASPLAPSALTFDNSGNDYVLTGDSLLGTFNFTKNGGALLDVQNINRFAGAINLNGGTTKAAVLANNIGTDFGSFGKESNVISFTNNAVLSVAKTMTTTHPLRLNGSDGTFDVEGSNVSLILNNSIVSLQGKHNITKTGDGSLYLYKSNTISNAIIKGGTLSLMDSADPDTLTLINGTVKDSQSPATSNSNASVFVVPDSCSGKLIMDPRCYYGGKLFGAGTFTVYSNYVRSYLNGDWSNFTGTIIPQLESSGCTFEWNNNYGIPKATLDVPSATIFSTGSHNVTIGNITGSGTISGTGTITVGTRNENLTFNTILKGMAVKKVGTGNWVMFTASGQKQITTMNIAEGSLNIFSSTTASLLGAAPVTVSGTGRLAGRGCVQSITLQSGATLAPGNYVGTQVGTLAVLGSLTGNEGSKVILQIADNKNSTSSRSYLDVAQTLTLNDSLYITLADSYVPAAGDSIVLWKATTFAGTPQLSLPTLPVGLAWDTSSLFQSDGVLKVTVSTGIRNLQAGKEYTVKVFTPNGQQVAEMTSDQQSLRGKLARLGFTGVYLAKFDVDGVMIPVKMMIK